MYKLAYTERFKKDFNNLSSNEQVQFQNKMRLFVENVLHPSLRTKKIKGFEYSDFEDYWKFSQLMGFEPIRDKCGKFIKKIV